MSTIVHVTVTNTQISNSITMDTTHTYVQLQHVSLLMLYLYFDSVCTAGDIDVSVLINATFDSPRFIPAGMFKPLLSL